MRLCRNALITCHLTKNEVREKEAEIPELPSFGTVDIIRLRALDWRGRVPKPMDDSLETGIQSPRNQMPAPEPETETERDAEIRVASSG